MKSTKARVVAAVLGSAATIFTRESVVGAGKKWAYLQEQNRSQVSERVTEQARLRSRLLRCSKVSRTIVQRSLLGGIFILPATTPVAIGQEASHGGNRNLPRSM